MANVIGNVKYLYEYNTAEREREIKEINNLKMGNSHSITHWKCAHG